MLFRSVTFTIKLLLLYALLVTLSYYGFDFINMIYCVDAKAV